VNQDSLAAELTSRSGCHLSSVFAYLRDQIGQDMARLKSQQLTLGRPVLFLLCADTPDDSPAWEAPYLNLVDRAGFPAAPDILACGIGPAPPEVIRKITARAQSFGWVAEPAIPLNEAASRFMTFVDRSIIARGQANIAGSRDTAVDSPAGFLQVTPQ